MPHEVSIHDIGDSMRLFSDSFFVFRVSNARVYFIGFSTPKIFFHNTMETRSHPESKTKRSTKTQEWDIETRMTIVNLHWSGMSLRKIGKCFDPPIAHTTVKSIIEKFEETGSVRNKPRPGLSGKLNDDHLQYLKKSICKDDESRRGAIKDITDRINEELNIDVSERTIRRAIKKTGLKNCPAVVKPYISPKNAALRVDWCKEKLKWTIKDWSKVCWSDECSVEVKGTGVRRTMVWRMPNERFLKDCLAPSFKSGRQSVMMWGCFIGDRLGPLVLCPEGKMNSVKYCSVLEESFLPLWRSLPDGSIFMEDGAPCHTSKFSKAWREKHNIKTMKWPAQSPDLNPIENIWHQLKTALEKRKPRVKNKEELLLALQEEWAKLQENNNLKALIKSMKSRVKMVIEAGGLPINY